MRLSHLRLLGVAALGGALPSVGHCDPGLQFVMFNDTALQRPAFLGVDTQLNMTLTGYNDCSRLWIGQITFPVTGEIAFDAECQQGLRLHIGGRLVIDGWGPDRLRRGSVKAQAGETLPLRLEYYHLGGEAFLRLKWSWQGHAAELVTPSALSHTDEDAAHAKAIMEGKELVGMGNQGPYVAPDEPVVSAPAGDEEDCSSIYAPGQASRSAEPLILGPGPHLFIDDHLVEQSEKVTRRVNRLERDPNIPNPIITGREDRNYQPFLTVLRAPETGLFRIWYGAYGDSPDGVTSHIGYMESDDGIHWKRPARQLEDPAPIQFGTSVIDDGPEYPDPSRRYKLGWWKDGGLKIATSPDGIEWTPLAPYVVLKHNHDITNIIRDPLRERYVATVSVYTTGEDWAGNRRITLQSESADLLHWSKPWLIIRPRPEVDSGETQFYAMNGHLFRGDLWIGLVKVLRDDLKAPGTPDGAFGVGYSALAWTRDGKHWVRDTDPFFEPDPDPAAWDHAHAWLDWQLPVGDEVFIYYGGYKSGHKMNRYEERQIGLVRMKRDRYVAREAKGEPGTLRTPLVTLDGASITLNARVQGELRVRVLGPEGRPLEGFGFDDCAPIAGDSPDHAVAWRGSPRIPQGQPVRLEFRLIDAELYSFDLHPAAAE